MAIRIFRKHSLLVMVNIIGLSIGLCSSLIVSGWGRALEANFELGTLFQLPALFLLLFSTFNYALSNTSSISQRGREIGIRKFLGSPGSTIKRQFVIETLIISIVSLLTTLVFFDLFFTIYLASQLEMSVVQLTNNYWVVLILLFLLITILGGGFIPLRNIINLNTIEIFRNKFLHSFRKEGLQKVNVMLQIGVTLIFLVFSFNYLQKFNDYNTSIGGLLILITISFVITLVSGLIGYGYYLLHSRSTEVMIRKTSGAQNSDINKSLYKEMGQVCIISLLITIPFLKFVIENWLSEISYKYNAGLNSYFIGICLLILVLVATFPYFINKIADKNPISIRR